MQTVLYEITLKASGLGIDKRIKRKHTQSTKLMNTKNCCKQWSLVGGQELFEPLQSWHSCMSLQWQIHKYPSHLIDGNFYFGRTY